MMRAPANDNDDAEADLKRVLAAGTAEQWAEFKRLFDIEVARDEAERRPKLVEC